LGEDRGGVMTRIIPFETEGTEIQEFKTDPKGKKKKVIKCKDWKGNPKELRKQAEKYKE